MDELGLQLGIAGIITGILGFATVVYLSKKNRPLFLIGTKVRRVSARPDLEIRLGSSIMKNLYSVLFVIWNASGRDILSEELPSPQSGPRLKFLKETQILFFSVSATSADDPGRLVADGSNEIHLQFDYLAKGEALLGEVLCTSGDGSLPEVSLAGNFEAPVKRLGASVELTLWEQVYFSFTALALFLYALWLARSAYLAFITGLIPAGIVFSLLIMVSVFLAVLDIRLNFLSSAGKVPEKYRHYFEWVSA